jgi:transmembrane sensor
MNKIVKLPDPREIKQQAAEWIVALTEGLTEQQRQLLHEWLAADPAHAEALVRMAEHWDALGALSELAVTFPLAERSSQRSRRSAFSRPALAALALLGVAIAASAGYLFHGAGRDAIAPSAMTARHSAVPAQRTALVAPATPATAALYETPVGKTLSARLADGSMLMLNTNTWVEVSFSAAERHVVLRRGEANFQVAHDQARPFRVQAGARVVQAVGTMFNVRLDGHDDLQVTVTEGTVKVLSPDPAEAASGAAAADAHPEMLVHAGEQALIGRTAGQVRRIDDAQLQAKEAWQHGVLIYRGEALDAVIADVSRYTTVRFQIPDESIRARRVGGVFRAGDVDGLLLALNQSFGIDAHRTGDVIVLTAER